MRSWETLSFLGLAIVLVVVASGCGGSSSSSTNPPPAQLAISSGPTLPAGQANVSYNDSLIAGGGTAPYSWTVSAGSLPDGLSLSTSGVLSGIPNSSGNFSFAVQVVDSETTPQRATAQLSMVIAPATLIVTTTSLPIGVEGVPYAATLTASGGVTPYEWFVTSGSLPAGLSLSTSGVISGTPTANGPFAFEVLANDTESPPQTAAAQLSITIAPPGLTVTTASLPAGVTEVSYTANLTAAGGVEPYSWSLASGDLPAGLSLSTDGAISGMPTTSGTSDFTVQVTDSGSPPQTAMADLSITVTTRVAVTTEHYDNFRSGQTTTETVLTPANVNSGHFGRLFSDPVDGFIYAQPLYVQAVTIPGKGVHNVVYVATQHDSVYAWDADNNAGQNSAPLWHTSFIDPAHGITPVSQDDTRCNSILNEQGITSTPVIDTATNTIYVVAQTKENGSFFQRLHALDITTGAEKLGGPTVITATYPGSGDGSSGGELSFDPLLHLNRPGLLLSNGVVYIIFSSNCDIDPYHGWTFAYDKTTLQTTSVWVTTPNGRRGGVWMSGGGIAADQSGNIYFSNGNGTFETSGDLTDYGDSIMKLTLAGSAFTVADYFTPYNEGSLDDGDVDVGAGGVLLLPDQPGPHVHEMIGAGKEGTIYLLDRDNLGHFNPTDNSQIVQNIPGLLGAVFSVPTYWNGNVYFGTNRHALKAFSLNNGLLSTAPTSQSTITFEFPGPTPSVSANGSRDGIVWALQTHDFISGGDDILYAFDATDLTHELYGTDQNPDRDDPGGAVKFQVPVVANGKVYIGAAQQVSVYGLLP